MKQQFGEPYNFKPSISDKNKKLAQKALSKKNPQRANMRLEDRLTNEKREIYEKREKLKIQNEAQTVAS